MKKALDFLTAKPALFFLLAALIWGGIMCYLNSKDTGENGFSWHDLLVEANGMVLDLLVFGALLAWYDGKRQKNERIERDKDLIDDLRGWENEEGVRKTVGAIKRLNKLKVTDIDLSCCFLKDADLRYVNLQEANLEEAILQSADLSNANLKGANFYKADLTNAFLEDVELEQAYLLETNLQKASLVGAKLQSAYILDSNLSGADLREANFTKADFSDSTFKSALVGQQWFENLAKWEVVAFESIEEKYELDGKGRLNEKRVD